MISYTRFNVTIMSLTISIIIFLLVNIAYTNASMYIQKWSNKDNFVLEMDNVVQIESSIKSTSDNQTTTKKQKKTENKISKFNFEEKWQICIPSINLEAEISEGTTKEVMDKYVGHFENTSIFEGNVGLAAHNRGYPVNYFANIKNLKNDDEIIYYSPYGNKRYKVILSIIILDTDWSYLQPTKDNRITLITCVEDRPEYRRCIQAIEIE